MSEGGEPEPAALAAAAVAVATAEQREAKKWDKVEKKLPPVLKSKDAKEHPSIYSTHITKIKAAFDAVGIEGVSAAIDAVIEETVAGGYDADAEHVDADIDAKLYHVMIRLADEDMMAIIQEEDIGPHGSHVVHLMATEFRCVSAARIAALQKKLFVPERDGKFANLCRDLTRTIADLRAVGVDIGVEAHKAALIALVETCRQTDQIAKSVAMWAIAQTPKQLRSAVEDWVATNDPPFEEGERGYGARGGTECFNCGERGHISRHCPKRGRRRKKRGGGGGGGGPQVLGSPSYAGCRKCGSKSHYARDCPESGSEAEDGVGGIAVAYAARGEDFPFCIRV